MSGVGIFDRSLSRICLMALRQILPRLSPEERIEVLLKLQDRALESLGESNALLLRRYAAKTVEQCVQRLDSIQQVEVLTDSTRKGLARINRDYLSEACAALINMTRLHPRLVDPASITARADDPRPVVVGPWLLEIGFELLYWIPYLRAELARRGVPKQRVIAVSRGGAEGWYSDIAGRYLDILDVMTAAEFHDWTAGKAGGAGEEILLGNRKTFKAETLETELLKRVLGSAGIDDYQVIMPSAMYGLMRNVWRGRFGGRGLDALLTHALLPVPEPVALPFKGPYSAVKFYNSRTFPSNAELDQFARGVVHDLAQQRHVVLLSNPARLDDHDTLSLCAGRGAFEIFDASVLYTPRNNLAVQTAIVAGVESLHGTYGGFSYLGPLLGVDTVAYTGTCDFTITHLDLAWTTFDRIGGAQLTMVPVRAGAQATNEANRKPGPAPRRRSRPKQDAHSI